MKRLADQLIDSGRLVEIIELCGETNDYEYLAQFICQMVETTQYEVDVDDMYENQYYQEYEVPNQVGNPCTDSCYS